MSATTTVIVHFHAKPGMESDLRRFLRPAIPRLSDLEGCCGGSLFHDIDTPDLFVLVEHWESVSAHKNYIDRIERDGTMDKLLPLLAGPPKRRYLNKT